MSETVTLYCLNDGKPFPVGNLPKLSGRAVKRMLEMARDADLEATENLLDQGVKGLELMFYVCYATVARMGLSVSFDKFVDGEDFEALKLFYAAIQERNAKLFMSNKADGAAAGGDADPSQPRSGDE